MLQQATRHRMAFQATCAACKNNMVNAICPIEKPICRCKSFATFSFKRSYFMEQPKNKVQQFISAANHLLAWARTQQPKVERAAKAAYVFGAPAFACVGKKIANNGDAIKIGVGITAPPLIGFAHYTPWVGIPLALAGVWATSIASANRNDAEANYPRAAKETLWALRYLFYLGTMGAASLGVSGGLHILCGPTPSTWLPPSLLENSCWVLGKEFTREHNGTPYNIRIDTVTVSTEQTIKDGDTKTTVRLDKVIGEKTVQIIAHQVTDTHKTEPRNDRNYGPAQANDFNITLPAGLGDLSKTDGIKQFHKAEATVTFPSDGFWHGELQQNSGPYDTGGRVGEWKPNSPTYQTYYNGQIVTLKCK
jgi:hypothetical protein